MKNLISIFEENFKTKPQYEITTPSRVNLIGEHSDYFENFVLPMAIKNIKMTSLMSPRDDDEIWLYSTTLKTEEPHVKIKTTSPRSEHQWIQYIQGAIAQYQEVFGDKLKGFNLLIDSTIPIGGGLSSSSALTMTSLAALGLANGFFEGKEIIPVEKGIQLLNAKSDDSKNFIKELCLAGCRSEWWYGTNGGAMDHFALTASRENHATLLDNRDFTVKYVEVPEELSIVICNTMVHHNQLYSGFAERKNCAWGGFDKINEKLGGKMKAVRDLTLEILEENKDLITETEYKRLKHPLTEKERVFGIIDAFRNKDFEKVGQLIHEGFVSLRDDYETSCEELNIMQKAAEESPGCFGARMTGGGFGGCIVAFVDKNKEAEFIKSVKVKYDHDPAIKAQNLSSEIWVAHSSDGLKIKEIENNS